MCVSVRAAKVMTVRSRLSDLVKGVGGSVPVVVVCSSLCLDPPTLGQGLATGAEALGVKRYYCL